MSNVIQLFGSKPKPASIDPGPIDTTGLSLLILDWADSQGIDYEDPGFVIRVSDLMGQLQIMAGNSRGILTA